MSHGIAAISPENINRLPVSVGYSFLRLDADVLPKPVARCRLTVIKGNVRRKRDVCWSKIERSARDPDKSVRWE